MKPQSIKLAKINIAAGTQTRFKICEVTVSEYAAAIEEGAKMPPVVLFTDGNEMYLADGWHRYHAHDRCGLKDILAEIKTGTVDDALIYSLGTNDKHGLPRNNADKRKIATIAVEKFPADSSSKIATVTGLSHTFIDKIRAEIAETLSKSSNQPATVAGSKRMGTDNKLRSLPKPKATIDEIADQAAASGKLSPGAAPVAPVDETNRGNSNAYTSAPAAKKERDLSAPEAAAVDGLEVCIENAKFVLGQIREGSYDPSESADLYKQFKDTMKLLSKLPKQ